MPHFLPSALSLEGTSDFNRFLELYLLCYQHGAPKYQIQKPYVTRTTNDPIWGLNQHFDQQMLRYQHWALRDLIQKHYFTNTGH